MPNLYQWIVGGLVAVIGLFGLYVASRAPDPTVHYIGLALFVGAVLFNFYQIKQAYNKSHK